MKRRNVKPPVLIGWQEWLALPELGIPALKAKIDTGARTSSLHAFDIQIKRRNGQDIVNFNIHPLQASESIVQRCSAKLVDMRSVMSSNGHRELRPVIMTGVALGDRVWMIELTLSNRDPLRFRMLLGRQALAGNVVIDPSKRLCLGKLSKLELKRLYG